MTDGQIRIIHTLKGVLGADDDTYRGTLEELFGITSSKLLSFNQAERFIEIMKNAAIRRGLWTTIENKYENLENRPGMASPAQLRMIEGIWHERYPQSDIKAEAASLRAFLYNRFRVSDLRFLDGRTAGKVLTALKAIRARGKPESRNASGRTLQRKYGG